MRAPRSCWAIAVLSFSVGLVAPAWAAPPRVAVRDLQATGASPELTAALTASVANELNRLGAFEVMTAEAMRQVLALSRQQQLMGCADERCAPKLGELLGVDYLLLGTVTKVPGRFGLELALVEAKSGRRDGSDVQQGQTELELFGKVGKCVSKTLNKLLAQSSGGLLVDASEDGAVVKVDDSAVGTTPMRGQLPLAAGPHELVVEKDGFVRFRKEVRVSPGQVQEERVVLAPSPDFIQAYEARASKVRLGAWLSTGAAVLAAGSAVYFQVRADQLYGTPQQEGTFQYHRARLLEGVEVEGEVDHRAQANQLKAGVDGATVAAGVGLGVAAAATVAAVYFWVNGDEPGRYRRFEPVKGPKVALAPTPNGAAAVLTLSFP